MRREFTNLRTPPTIVTLPYPPSANSMWRNVSGKTLKSDAYRKWIKAAHAECVGIRRLKGPFVVSFVATRPDERVRDLDNLLKPLMDALKHVVFEDDSLAQEITIKWSAVRSVPGGQVVATVEAAA